MTRYKRKSILKYFQCISKFQSVMFSMTTSIEAVNENLLQASFQMDFLRSRRQFQALQVLDPEINDTLNSISNLIDTARSIAITYVETIRNDRRDRRHRYKANRQKRRAQTTV